MGGRVGPGPVGVARKVDADFFAWPTRLVNVRKPFRQAHALFAHEWRDAHDPAAVGAVMIPPKISAINGGCRFQDLRELCGEACGARFLPPAGKLIANLESSQ